MSDKDEALRLADALESLEATGWGGDCFALTDHSQQQAELAAAMLRSQHARIQDLEEGARVLFGRIAELEAELAEQCRINAMGAERELSALNRARELEAVARVALEALGTCIEAPHGARWYSPDRVETAIASLSKTLGEA